MPGQQQIHNLWELVQGWRLDALEFCRKDAPRILVILIVSFILLRVMKVIANRLSRFSRQQTVPSGVRSQQLRRLTFRESIWK